MGPKKYRPRSIVGQGQLYQKSRILDLLGSHNIFFRTFTPNVRITVHLDIHFSEFFVVNDMNQDCPGGQNITDESDCLSAAPEFEFCRGSAFSHTNWRHGCFLHPPSCKVYFNRNTHQGPDGKSYAICKGSGGATTTETGQI